MLTMPFISVFYSLAALAAAIGYLPQIVSLAYASDKDNSSVSTWVVWLGIWVFAFAYGMNVLQDWRFCAIALLNVIGNVAILSVVLFNRYLRFAKLKAAS